MDTDDLSKQTYKGVLLQAEKFNHDLTLQFGVLASNCKNDDDYLNQAEVLIKEWMSVEDFEEIVDDIFYGNSVDETSFKKTLTKILANISTIRKTPMTERKFDF
jgi:hypothetical protein